MHDIVCFVFYQSSVLVIEVIIGDMSKKKKKKKKKCARDASWQTHVHHHFYISCTVEHRN